MPFPALAGTLESALYAGDLAAAEAFYGGLLGLPVIARQPGRHVFFRVGDSVLLVFDPAATAAPPPAGARLPVPAHGARGPGHYCFRAVPGTLDAVRAGLEANGIGIEADFFWPTGARSLYVRDPAGNSVEFAEAALWFGAG
ncbi:MAG: VOC family protein [Paracoccaceae bacterium]